MRFKFLKYCLMTQGMFWWIGKKYIINYSINKIMKNKLSNRIEYPHINHCIGHKVVNNCIDKNVIMNKKLSNRIDYSHNNQYRTWKNVIFHKHKVVYNCIGKKVISNKQKVNFWIKITFNNLENTLENNEF